MTVPASNVATILSQYGIPFFGGVDAILTNPGGSIADMNVDLQLAATGGQFLPKTNLASAFGAVTLSQAAFIAGSAVLTIDAKTLASNTSPISSLSWLHDFGVVVADFVTVVGDAGMVASSILNQTGNEPQAKIVDGIGVGLTTLGMAFNHADAIADFSSLSWWAVSTGNLKAFLSNDAANMISADISGVNSSINNAWNATATSLSSALGTISSLITDVQNGSYQNSALSTSNIIGSLQSSVSNLYTVTGASAQSIAESFGNNSVSATNADGSALINPTSITYSPDGTTTTLATTGANGLSETDKEFLGNNGAVDNIVQQNDASGADTINATVNGLSFSDTLANTQVVLDASGNAQFLAPTTWGNTAAFTQPSSSGPATFTVGRDVLDLAGVTSLSGSNGVFSFGLTPQTSSFSEGLTWNSNTGYATLGIGTGSSVFTTPIVQINPGDTFVGTSTAFSLWNSAGQEVSSTTVNGLGIQNDYTFNTGTGSWLSTDWVYNATGAQLAVNYANKDGSAVDDFYDPNRNEALADQVFLSPNGSSTVTGSYGTIDFAAGDTPVVSIAADGSTQVGFTPLATGNSESLDLSQQGISLTTAYGSLTNNLSGLSTAVAADGTVNFKAALTTSTQEFLTAGANGADTVSIGQDNLYFTSGVLSAVSNANGTPTFNLTSPSTTTANALIFVPSTGKLLFDATDIATGKTFVSSGGYVGAGGSATYDGNMLSVANSAGKVLYTTQTDSGGNQIDTSNNANDSGSTSFIYNNQGQLIGNVWVNADSSAVSDTYNPANGVMTRQTVIGSDGTLDRTYYDPSSGTWLYTVNFDNKGNATSVNSNPLITYSQLVGVTADAAAGQIISQFLIKNNLPASLAARAFANASVSSLTQSITSTSNPYLVNGQPISNTTAFAADFSSSLTNMAITILGSDAGAAFARAIGIPVQVGQTLGNVAGSVTAEELSAYIANNVFDVTSGAGVATAANGATTIPDVGLAFESAGAGALGNFLGTELSSLIIGHGNTGSAIGDAIGTATFAAAGASTAVISDLGLTVAFTAAAEEIGAILGTAIPVPIVGTLIGATVGALVGSLIGSLFGSHKSVGPDAGSLNKFNPNTQQFYVFSVGGDNGGNTDGVASMGNALNATLNQILASMGGTVVGQPQDMSLLWFQGNYYYAFGDQSPRAFPNESSDPNVIVQGAAFAWLKSVTIQGGDPYMQYVFQNSSATTLTGLISDLNVAHDYSQYISNPLAFDMALATSGNPNQLQAWQTELAQAQAMGLDKFAPTGTNTVSVNDSSTNILAHAGILQSMIAAGQITSVTFTDTPNLTLTASQNASYASLLDKVTSSFNTTILADNNTSETITGAAHGINTVSFANAANGIVANLMSGQVTQSQTITTTTQVPVSTSGPLTGYIQMQTVTTTSTATYTDQVSNVMQFIGSSHNDFITSGSGNSTLTGGGGNDTLVGSTSGGTTFADIAANFTAGEIIQNLIAGNVIDIKDMIPGLEKFSFSENNSGTSGLFTATDGTHTAAVTLAGQFSAAGLYATADGSGGTQYGYMSPSSPGYAAFVAAHPNYTFG